MKAASKPSVSATGSAEPVAVASSVRDGGDRREHSDAERASDLLRRVDQPGGEAGLGVAHSGQRGDRDRHEREAQSDRDQEEAGQQVGRVRAVDRDLCEVDEPGGEHRHAGDQHRLDADAV